MPRRRGFPKSRLMLNALDEKRRLDILRRYAILDTPPEPIFDRIAWLAATHFGTPIGTVTFVDDTRQWFKANLGLDIRWTTREVAFCDHTIRQSEVLEVPDATRDPRFADNPLVTGQPFIRFYAGAPLRTRDGLTLGTVSVIDMRPRPPLDTTGRRFLQSLAELVVEELEMRMAAGDVKAEIAERRRAEAEQRAAKEAAERADRSKTRFLAAASHDLRQPMQSLLLSLGILRQRLRGTPLARVAQSAAGSADAMRGLLDALLDISRIEAGLVRCAPTDLPLGPLIERLGGEYAARARAKGLRLRWRACPLAARADPVLLERMLRNLLENAIRYTDRGGILVGCRRSGGRLRLEVVDTGVGLAPEHSDVIFDEFVQLANPERDRAKGLGLGLAIVKRLAALQGIEVGVRSHPGQGSRFFVTLPGVRRADAQAAAPDVGDCADKPLSGRVLIIDDERSVLEALGWTLGAWGLEVLTAESAAQALSLVAGHPPPNLLLADYRLRGGATGVEAIDAVRRTVGHAIPAVLITGDTSPERLAEATASGNALLHKPVAAEELRRAVEGSLWA